MIGDAHQRVVAALGDRDPENARAVRAVLREMGTPEAVIAATAGGVARAPLKARPNVCAVAGLLCGCLWVAGLGSLSAIVLGHRAVASIQLSDGRQFGRRLALTAIFLGWVGLAVPLLVVLQ